jgi:hypothetical protein
VPTGRGFTTDREEPPVIWCKRFDSRLVAPNPHIGLNRISEERYNIMG